MFSQCRDVLCVKNLKERYVLSGRRLPSYGCHTNFMFENFMHLNKSPMLAIPFYNIYSLVLRFLCKCFFTRHRISKTEKFVRQLSMSQSSIPSACHTHILISRSDMKTVRTLQTVYIYRNYYLVIDTSSNRLWFRFIASFPNRGCARLTAQL